MKSNKTLIWAFVLLVVIASLYRIIPNRPWGFAPQWAMAIFAGSVVKDKKWAFIMPVLSMFISDLLYQVLFSENLSPIQGFYEGQWQNYLLFALLVFIGFAIRKLTVVNILIASIAAPTFYFILSNFIVWAGWQGTRGLGRPRTFNGLMQTYADGIPFYRTSIVATILFSAVLFGSYFLITRRSNQPVSTINVF